MKQRVLTALILTPVAIAIVLLLPSVAFAAITGIAFLLALWEWTRMTGLRTPAARAGLVAAAAAMLVLLWSVREDSAWWIVIGIGAAWWLIVLGWLRHFTFGAAPTRENTGLKLVAGLLVVVPAWAALLEIHRSAALGPVWALFALMLVWAADTFAYFAGTRWGRAKLAPHISPGKTIAGVWGALVGSGVIALVGGVLLKERGVALAGLFVLAMVTVAFSIVGDLFESLIKRQAQVKDSGALFPGHGGLFDRLDSVFAALPVFAVGKALLDALLAS